MDENSAEESDSAEEPETVADPERKSPNRNGRHRHGLCVYHTDECYSRC
ncbi:MAG: hypothetical protein ACLRNW_21520 [Neglectibacter sp.]